jgi:hypothetical protein
MAYLSAATGRMNRFTRRAVAKQMRRRRWSRLYSSHQDERKDRAIDWRVLALLKEYALRPDEVAKVFDMLYRDVKTKQGRHFAASYHDRDSFIQNQEAFLAGNNEKFHGHGNPNLSDALKDLSDEMPSFGWKVTRPQSEEEVKDLIPELQASAGYYGFITGKTKTADNLKFIYERLNKVIDSIINDDLSLLMEEVIITETRHQVSEPFDVDGNLKDSKDIKEKTRLVWSVPKVVVILENIFERYVFDWLSHTDWYANGKDPVTRRNLILNKRLRYQHCYTLDASSFDLHVPGELIRLIRQTEKKMFNLSPEMEKIFDAVSYYYTHKPLYFKDDHVEEIRNGMPSGMKGTNDLDSMCFRIMIDTYAKHLGWVRGRDYSTIHDGDDVLLFFNNPLDMEDFASYLKWNFGTIIDPLKFADNRRDSKRGVFFNKKYFGSIQGEFRHPYNLIARACFPEQSREYSYMKGKVRPEMIIEAYIETYSAGMIELIDVEKFRRDFSISRNSLRSADLRSLPGAVQAIIKGW